MEGQGVAASSAAAAGRQGKPGPGAVAAAEFGHPAETHVTSDIMGGGEGRGRNGDDSHVMVGPGHPEASSQDDGMPHSPDSSQPPRPPAGGQASREAEGQSSQESQAEFPSQQIKSDKADNVGDPDRNNSVVARDENTGHNKTAAGLAPSAVDAPAVNSPAEDDSPAAAPSGVKAAASAASQPETASSETASSETAETAAAQPETAPPDTGDPETVQFAAIPAEDEDEDPGPAGPAADATPDEPAPAARPDASHPEPAGPAAPPVTTPPAETGEPETVQFAAIPPEPTQTIPEYPQTVPEPSQAVPEYPQTVVVPEPVIRPATPGPADEPATVSEATEAKPEPRPAPAAPATVAAAARTQRSQAPQGHTRVDARLLEAALLNLRKRVAAIPLVFQISGSAEVKTERGKLLSQIDDYLLPRVRRSAAPILVALVGSTGAGKSTLVNSIVGARVSATGVRRPTTNSPVLACHPDEIDWFAENNFLPTLPRVRQEGLARPGRDGLLVLAASEGMPRGIALLDTPDIDSVVQAHHEFALQFLDASDLWLFMTSASRYADGPVWEILQHARDRKASLGVVLSRIPQAYRTELVDHFSAMLDANGIAAADRFVIQETPLIDGMLPPDAYQPVRDWLAYTAVRSDRRVAVLSQTMSGVLDTFKSRVPAVAAHVEAQVVLREQLREAAETAYQNAFAEASDGLRDGTLLRGEVLARWEDCMVGGDLRPRRGGARAAKGAARKGKRARRGPSRTAALNAALRSAIESYIVSVADRAAEAVEGSWRADPAGAVLLADAAAERARDVRAKQVFESVFGPAGQSGGDAADADIKAADLIKAADAAQASAFSRSSPDLALRATRAIG